MPAYRFSLLAAVAVAAAALTAAPAHAAALPPQVSSADGVMIQLTPADVSGQAKEWTFDVALNTHSGSLGDEVAAEATLIDAGGKAQRALGWSGDPPGGHHRKGVLRFTAPSPRPATLELRIQRANEPEARVFRWALQ
jgi:hypothetical protein